jgi:outer membrane immunogenic protein
LTQVGGGSARAGDLDIAAPPSAPAPARPAAHSWTGCHFGIDAGGAFGSSQHIQDEFHQPARFGWDLTDPFTVSGVTLGTSNGCDYQAGMWVIGGERDFSWTHVRGTGQLLPTFSGSASYETNQQWLDTERLRLGAALDRWFFYATGGAAFADEEQVVCSTGIGCGKQSRVAMGWALGAGIEYALSDTWSARLEYLFVDFGKTSFPGLPFGGVIADAEQIKLTNNIVRLGLNHYTDFSFRANPTGPGAAQRPYSWTGCHLGVEAGAVLGRSQNISEDARTPKVVGQPETDVFNLTGAMLAGVAGCDHQSGLLVVGWESDLAWTNDKGTTNTIPPFTPTTNTHETSQKWLNTERVRVGAAWDRWFAYGTAGTAFGDESIQSCDLTFGCGNASATVAGWTIGTGVEYGFWSGWAAKLEYLYVDFGSPLFPETPISGGHYFYARDVKLADHIFRVGLDYNFDPFTRPQ